MSGSFWPSALRTTVCTCTSFIPALGKERANRTVGKPAGENFLFRRAAFAFEVAAGEHAAAAAFRGSQRSGKKVLAFLGLGGGHRGHDDDGFAELDGYGAVRLFGEFSGFNDDCLSPTWAVIFSGI